MGEEEYARLMAAAGPNTVDGIDARNVESAIAQLGVGEECAPDRVLVNAGSAPHECQIGNRALCCAGSPR